MGRAIPTVSTVTVLCLTKEVIFALDLQDALAGAGLTAVIPVLRGRPTASYRSEFDAVVVDADGLDKRGAAIIRRHVRANVPVCMISDSYDVAQMHVVDQSAWFTKPVQTEEVAAFIASRIGRGMVAQNDRGPRKQGPQPNASSAS